MIINKTTLTKEELIKLNLTEIELIDGFWYYKSDLEGNVWIQVNQTMKFTNTF